MVQLAASEFVATVREFAALLAAERATLDALNVFPVADSDTGTNMQRSVDAVVRALDALGPTASFDDVRFDDVRSAVEDAALEGRGNSGLIIGQFLAGVASAGVVSAGAEHGEASAEIDLAAAVAAGAERARQAVAQPVEGTMLTVADTAASALAELPTLPLDALVSCVRGAVAATPTQLAVLAERGVVDSGAAGLQLFFEALASVDAGTDTARVDTAQAETALADDPEADLPKLISCDVGLVESVTVGHPVVGYELQFRVSAAAVEPAEVQALLASLGTDVVVVTSSNDIAAHVHVVDPSAAASAISAELEDRDGVGAISYDVEPLLDHGGMQR